MKNVVLMSFALFIFYGNLCYAQDENSLILFTLYEDEYNINYSQNSLIENTYLFTSNRKIRTTLIIQDPRIFQKVTDLELSFGLKLIITDASGVTIQSFSKGAGCGGRKSSIKAMPDHKKASRKSTFIIDELYYPEIINRNKKKLTVEFNIRKKFRYRSGKEN
jgi:hypothetical protein